MLSDKKPVAIIGGIGTHSEFSAALIQSLLSHHYTVICIARSPKGKENLCDQFNDKPEVEFLWGNLADSTFVQNTIVEIENQHGAIQAYIHNATQLMLKPFLKATLDDFEQSWQTTVKTAITVSQTLLPYFQVRQKGTLLFSGATASIKGNAGSAPFAIAKFALRALSQSLAREFGPQGIHVAHIITDGVIIGQRAQETFKLSKNQCIEADSLARLYLNLMHQDRSCWTQEIDVRPYLESF